MKSSSILTGSGLVFVLLATATSSQAQPDSELPPEFSSAIDPELVSRPTAPAGPKEPGRILFQLGVGTTLRIVRNLDFQQERFAPPFLEAFGAFVLPGRGLLRHGVGLGLATNLSGDGTFTDGIDGFQQWVLAPSYVLSVGFGDPLPSMFFLAKAGPSFAVTPDFSPGLDIAAGFTYQFLAGFGAYVEATFSGYFGADSTFHPTVSAELGFQIDYELLP